MEYNYYSNNNDIKYNMNFDEQEQLYLCEINSPDITKNESHSLNFKLAQLYDLREKYKLAERHYLKSIYYCDDRITIINIYEYLIKLCDKQGKSFKKYQLKKNYYEAINNIHNKVIKYKEDI